MRQVEVEKEREREKNREELYMYHWLLIVLILAASENDKYFSNGLSVKYTSLAVHVHSSIGYYCNHV